MSKKTRNSLRKSTRKKRERKCKRRQLQHFLIYPLRIFCPLSSLLKHQRHNKMYKMLIILRSNRRLLSVLTQNNSKSIFLPRLSKPCFSMMVLIWQLTSLMRFKCTKYPVRSHSMSSFRLFLSNKTKKTSKFHIPKSRTASHTK